MGKKEQELAKLAYEKAKPEQFGDLHQRMKFLVKLVLTTNRSTMTKPQWDLILNAILDLKIGVCGHTPITPPVGRQSVILPKKSRR